MYPLYNESHLAEVLPSLQVPLGDALKSHDEVAEAGTGQPEIVDYQAIETRILNPVRDAYALIVKITLAIGCLYGAHG